MTYRRVLIIRPSALGDVCRSVPVLTSLRKALPEARIDWLVQAEFIDAVRAHPALNHAIPFARKEMAIGRLHRRQARSSLSGLIHTLREPEYDLVIDCQGLARSGLFARLTGARTRIGHADARELAWLHYTRRVPPGNSPHTVDRMLDLIRALDIQP
ncbi:MAG: glycosyltransferase family 9 protein, partial [Phycisphaerales bacterium]